MPKKLLSPHAVPVDIYFKEIPKIIDMSARSELYSVNEYTFAIAVILSAQATDKKVNEVTPDLFKVADTPQKMLELGEERLKEHLKVLSFFNNKARNIIGMSKMLADVGGKLPKTQKELMKLPGIGQKTANVIMNVLWDKPFIGVDTHVMRLSRRFGWVSKSDNTPEKIELKLLDVIPEKYHGITNHVMVLHGRYTCKAIKPLCGECPIYDLCNAPDKRHKKV